MLKEKATSTWSIKDIIRTETTYECSWFSISESACCPHCKQISTEKSKTYFTHKIQDTPIQGRAVYHNVRKQRFNCVNPDCKFDNFFERYEEVVGIYGRKTAALDKYISHIDVESSAEGAARVLEAQGVKTGVDSILRLIRKKGLLAMKQQLEKDNIVTLGCDDINRRKGNGSTACTVFINADTHKFITMVAGKDSAVAETFLKSHPNVKTMTRDRATVYASAASQ